MYSSRMRTVRSSSHVYPSIHWARGGCVSQQALGRWWGCLPGRGVSAQGVCVCVYPSMYWVRHPPVNRMTVKMVTRDMDGDGTCKTNLYLWTRLKSEEWVTIINVKLRTMVLNQETGKLPLHPQRPLPHVLRSCVLLLGRSSSSSDSSAVRM